MAWADSSPQIRASTDAGAVDALWLGIAQASALIPGVSRNGATLAAARWREFTREDANRLSRHVALPVIAGATLLKGARLARRGLPPRTRGQFAAGAAASFPSTRGSTWLIRQVERDRSLWRYAAYRIALAGAVAIRLRSRRRGPPDVRQSLHDCPRRRRRCGYPRGGSWGGGAGRRPAEHRARAQLARGAAAGPLRERDQG